MRSIFSILASLALTFAIPSGAAADPRMADVVKVGKLRIGVFPSFQFSRDAAGQDILEPGIKPGTQRGRFVQLCPGANYSGPDST